MHRHASELGIETHFSCKPPPNLREGEQLIAQVENSQEVLRAEDALKVETFGRVEFSGSISLLDKLCGSLRPAI